MLFAYPFSGEILCAPDSFKGTLSAAQAAAALERGVKEVWPSAPVRLLPLADGGEGSLSVLYRAAGGDFCPVRVEGPLGAPVDAVFLRLPDGTAVVEMAQASGLLLAPLEKRDPEAASTYGTGQLIAAALESGARTIIVCLGGSATTDGGAGMVDALQFKLVDTDGRPLTRGGGALERLAHIDSSSRHPALEEAAIIAATDVTNPLCGPHGAAAVYGPQKGANLAQVQRLERGLDRLAEILKRDQGVDVRDLAGAGAAGGLGAGLVGFLGATIQSGAEVLMDAAGLPAAIQQASLCLTGEGRIDLQSSQGKLISRLARRCRSASVPLVAIGGGVAAGGEALLAEGVSAILSATQEPGLPPTNSKEAARLLQAAAATACRLVQIGVK